MRDESVPSRQRAAQKKPSYYSRAEIVALLDQADKEVNERPESWEPHRLRALIYTEAYTGARIGEVLHLEWDREIQLAGGKTAREIDFELGIAFMRWKIEHGLKTEGSEAPVGLPDALIAVLRDWKTHQRSQWVFPNKDGKPWTTGGPGYKSLDQLKVLAKRAHVAHATWKMFRHSMNTHGKQWFGLSAAQMKVQLRHEDVATQKHYEHAALDNLRAAVKDMDFRQ